MNDLKNFIATTIKEYIKENSEDNYNILYHGSPYKFDILKKDIGKKTGGDEYGYGIYLTNDKNLAIHYAKQNGYVYTLKINNNLNFLSDNKKVSKNNLERIRNMIIYNEDIVDNKNVLMGKEQKQFIINNIIKNSKNGLDLYVKIQRIFPITDKQLSEMMEEQDINGIIGNDGKETVVFNTLNIIILSIKALS